MVAIPRNSQIHDYSTNAYFSDCFMTNIPYNGESALELFLSTVNNVPKWVDFLMTLRNEVVEKIGLKNLGKLSEVDVNKPLESYKKGDRVGIFSIYENSEYEVILEDQDKHLGVKISLFIEPLGQKAKVYLSTVVHVNNMLGKVYMLFVVPIHKIIVPTVLHTLPKK